MTASWHCWLLLRNLTRKETATSYLHPKGKKENFETPVTRYLQINELSLRITTCTSYSKMIPLIINLNTHDFQGSKLLITILSSLKLTSTNKKQRDYSMPKKYDNSIVILLFFNFLFKGENDKITCSQKIWETGPGSSKYYGADPRILNERFVYLSETLRFLVSLAWIDSEVTFTVSPYIYGEHYSLGMLI